MESHGTTDIRRIEPGCVLLTCVKGDLAQACETGLRRLAKYVDGDNQAAVRLNAVRPVLQRQLAPRRWLISVRLPDIQNIAEAPAPLSPKVKVVWAEAETVAVRRMSGYPSYGSVAEGVHDAITSTEWVATGAPAIRHLTLGLARVFSGGFEVSVPVTCRPGPGNAGGS